MNKKNKLVPPELGKASEVFRKVNRAKFLYLGNDLLLHAAPKNTMIETLKLPDLENSLKFQMVAMLPSFDTVTTHCNETIKDLKRMIKYPKGFHVPSAAQIEKELKLKIINGELNLNNLSNEVKDEIIVKTLTNEDYIKPQEGNILDWLNFMKPDGKVFPYTIITDNALSFYGFPTGLITKGNENVDPSSIKHIYYIDPMTKKLIKGTYFEVYEGPGPLGSGGINGIIVEGNKPIIIINTNKNGAYFVNVEDSRKNLGGMDLFAAKLEVVG